MTHLEERTPGNRLDCLAASAEAMHARLRNLGPVERHPRFEDVARR
jgi:hypothetical protein